MDYYNRPGQMSFYNNVNRGNRESVPTPKSFYLKGFKLNSDTIDPIIDFQIENTSGDQVTLMVNENLYPGVIYNFIETKSKQFKFIIKVEKAGKESVIRIRPKDFFEFKTLLKQKKNFYEKSEENSGHSQDVVMESEEITNQAGIQSKNVEERIITPEELLNFIGEFVYFLPKRQEIRLASSLDEIKKKKTVNSYKKGEICTILNVDYLKIVTSNEKEINTSLFCRFNKIDPSYPLHLLKNRSVRLLSSNNSLMLKLLPQLKKMIFQELDTVSFDEQNAIQPIHLLQNTQNIDTRFRFKSEETNLKKPGFFISKPARHSLSFALSLSLLENRYRYHKLSVLYDKVNQNIEQTSNLREIISSFNLGVRNMGEFYKFVYRYVDTIQTIGNEILKNITIDMGKISSIQTLADFLGIFIVFYNFSEDYYKIVFEPSQKRELVEVIHLGMMNKSYFVVYPDEVLSFEMVDLVQYKNLDNWPTVEPLFRGSNKMIEEKLINLMMNVSKNLISLNKTCVNKAKGVEYKIDFDPNFEQEKRDIIELNKEYQGLDLTSIYNLLSEIDVNMLIYQIPLPKFTCLCCREKFADVKEIKEVLTCGCEYHKDHFEQKVKKTFEYCFCRKSAFSSAGYNAGGYMGNMPGSGSMSGPGGMQGMVSLQHNGSAGVLHGRGPIMAPQNYMNPHGQVYSSNMNQDYSTTAYSNHGGVGRQGYPNQNYHYPN